MFACNVMAAGRRTRSNRCISSTALSANVNDITLWMLVRRFMPSFLEGSPYSFTSTDTLTSPLRAGSLARRVAVPFTFSNGLHLPTGTVIFAPNAPILFDSLNYPNPRIFDGFRFSNLRSRPGQEHNYTFTSPSLKNLQFGEGRHTWYGPQFSFQRCQRLRISVQVLTHRS